MFRSTLEPKVIPLKIDIGFSEFISLTVKFQILGVMANLELEKLGKIVIFIQI